jgi:hypothetical protein
VAGVSGGKKLAAYLLSMITRVRNDEFVNVGFQNKLTYPAEGSKNPVFVAQVAFWNEYGTRGVPSRPFFRTMIAAKSPTWGKDIAKLLKYHNGDTNVVLGLMGERMTNQLRDSIVSGGWQGNSARTIAKKGFDKPLQDSAIMVREGISYEVHSK